METKTTKCTSCGAPVPIDGSCRNVTCLYCGATIVVSDFEEIKVAEASANTRIVQEQLNQQVADRKRERIEQLEADLHEAECAQRTGENIVRASGGAGCLCFILAFVISWHFLWIGMIFGLVCFLVSLNAVGHKAKAVVARKQIDSMIK